MAIETPDQKALLGQIAEVAQVMEGQQDVVSTTRSRLQQLMVEAKKLKITSYRIAEVAKISQPRVLQIIKEVKAREEPPSVEELPPEPPSEESP